MAIGIPVKLFYKNRNYSITPSKSPIAGEAGGGLGGVITFDLILSEQHTFNNQVSDHNVEYGSVITDHIKNELQTGSFVGLISNFSIKPLDSTQVDNKAQTAFDMLMSLWQSRQLVTIVTVMHVYIDVAITGISIARSSSTGEAIEANISFKKIKIVTLQQVQTSIQIGNPPPIKIPDTTTPQQRQSSPNINLNFQQGSVPDSNSQLTTNIVSHTNQ